MICDGTPANREGEPDMRFTSREAVEYFRRLRDEGVHIISGHDPASFERAVCFTQ